MRASHGLWLVLAVSLANGACTCSKQPPTMQTLKNENEACANDEECVTGLCDGAAGTHAVCLRKCTMGCKADEVCTQLTPNRFACSPDEGGLCRPCSLDADCPYPADKCIVVDGAGVCGRDCAFDMSCPTSYRCVNGVGTDGKAKSQQCTPSSGSCTCTAATAGQTISCSVSNGYGTCQGKRTCDGVAGYGACDAHTPSVEVCNGIDDDCNGKVDENQPQVSCGVGLCARTVSSCADGGVATCMPGSPVAELCNGLDDDCNGVVDNGFDLTSDRNNCGQCGNVCMLANATARCDARACIVDTCATGFGNCDGVQSNGCEKNLTNDVNNCGTCGYRCSNTGSTPSCVNGTCQYACAPGYYDLDGNLANGCEYACTFTSAVDEPDVAFTDANCDGMDGEVNNGIYVSATTGNDQNLGTMAAPKATIAAGLLAAQQQGKRDVYVAAGNYAGPLQLSGVTGKNLAGGYAPATTRWTRSNINVSLVSHGNPALAITDAGTTLVQFLTFSGDPATGTEADGTGKTAYGAQVRNSSVRLELLTISAGAGAPGANGTDGTAGLPGGSINAGIHGNNGVQNDGSLFCSTGSQPAIGQGGPSACGRTGGAGGAPGLAHSGAGSTGQPGGNGVGPTAGGVGGPPYTDSSAPYATPLTTQNGSPGLDGTPGATAPAPSTVGTLGVAGYLPPITLGGGNGTHGNGGGGGAGGGGGCQDWNILGVLQLCACYTWGSSGGGGGGGGCAGTGGTAGKSGGASVGLMLWDSQVTAKLVTLGAARGGDGGRGGTGGAGSFGGGGAVSIQSFGSQGYSGIGGTGGHGGMGGSGGPGAGGTGGSSFNLLRNLPSTGHTGSSINTSQLSFTFGSAGNGGASSGNTGPNGQVVSDQQL